MLGSPYGASYWEWRRKGYQLRYPRSHSKEWILSFKICREKEVGDRCVWDRREMVNNLGGQNSLAKPSRGIDPKYSSRPLRRCRQGPFLEPWLGKDPFTCAVDSFPSEKLVPVVRRVIAQ